MRTEQYPQVFRLFRLAGVVLVIIGASCRPAPPPPVSPALAHPARAASLSDISMLQQTGTYRRAVACYTRKDYAHALVLIDRLLAVPDRTAEQRAFLQRQRDICRTAQHGGVQAFRRSGVQAVTPPPRHLLRTPEQADCGPRALLLVCQKLGVEATIKELRRKAGTTGFGTTMDGLAKAARAKGLKADGVQVDQSAVTDLDKPAITWMDGCHYMAVLSVDGDQATIHDPNMPGEEVIKTEELLRRSSGILLTLAR